MTFHDDVNKDIFTEISDKFAKEVEKINMGSTAELCIHYWDMLTMVRSFLKAERTGDWFGHLTQVERMVPYFHGSGHFR